MQTHEQTYFSARGQVITAFFVALVIVLNNQSIPVLKIIRYLGFYVSVAFSWLFAWMIIHFIAWLSKSIDGFPRWNKTYDIRFVMQMIGGVAVPCLAAVALAFGFLEGFGRDFRASGYLTHEFPIICLLIVIMNLTYLLLHYRQEANRLADELNAKTGALRKAVLDGQIWKKRTLILKQKLETAKKDAAGISKRLLETENALAALEAKLKVRSGGADTLCELPKLRGFMEIQGALSIDKIPYTEIRYIEYEKRRAWVYTSKSPHFRRTSLQEIQKSLPANWFFRVRNNAIINRMYIIDGPGIKKGRSMEITLRLPKKQTKTLTIHRRKVAAYLEWFSLARV